MFALTNAAHSALPISSVSNDFKVHGFKDYEAISSLYAIQIELVIESFDFDLESLLRQPRFLEFDLNGEGINAWFWSVAFASVPLASVLQSRNKV